MSWERPTLQDLNKRTAQALSAYLLDGAPLKANSVLSVIAATRAGGDHIMHGFLAWAFKQIFIDQAEDIYLEGWASVWGLNRKQPDFAQGKIILKGEPQTVVPDGFLLKSEKGLTYRLTGLTLEESESLAEIQAIVAGAEGNLAAGETLKVISPLLGLNNQAEVALEALKGGVDSENDDSLRQRLLEKIQKPPHGGNKNDYEHWAREVSGVENAHCYPLYAGLGTVGLLVWGAVNDPLLSMETLEKVNQYILERCPVTAANGFAVFSPEILKVNLEIYLAPNTLLVQENVRQELNYLFAKKAWPNLPIFRSHLNEAISIAAGEYDHHLLSPTSDIVPSTYQLPVLGDIIFSGKI